MTMPVIQTSFGAGEIAPSLYGQVDLTKYHSGAALLRNFQVDYRGGAISRPGTQFIGQCKSSTQAVRLIPFQFSVLQNYALEFGNLYMRVIKNGGYVLETAKVITAISKANPGAFTSNAHGFSNGDWVNITGVVGMTQVNGLEGIVAGATTNTFTLTDLQGNAIDTTGYTTYVSGGTASRVYTLATPYNYSDLALLKFAQDKDTMTLTHTSYAPRNLTRSGDASWILSLITFASAMTAPGSLTGTALPAGASTTLSYTYVVTSLDADLFEESIASGVVTVKNIALDQTTAKSNVVAWGVVAGAGGYNVYKALVYATTGGVAGTQYGYIGTTNNTSFTDANFEPDYTRGPPTHTNPFDIGQLDMVNITGGGASYTQAGVGFTITTSTGSGFSGTPIVTGGAVTSFSIANNGKSYANTDTIAFTGGSSQAASGYLQFSGNPANNDTITLNGLTWTFVTSGPTTHQTQIQATLILTLAQLASDLNASGASQLTVATYNATSTFLDITYNTTGTAGNAYAIVSGTSATVSGATLTGGSTGGGGATGTLTVGAQSGTYPGVVCYFQQRKTFAASSNLPDTIWATQTALYNNMDVHQPVRDDDALQLSLNSQQVNAIKAMVPMASGLIVLTGNGAWQLLGAGSSSLNPVAITPSDATAQPQAYNGCNDMPPIVSNYDILFVQNKNNTVRDLSYNFYVNVYTGTDMTVLANHLFFGHNLLEWAFAEEPYKTIWVIRDDGVLLSFAYLKEQNVYAWAHHDTFGLFQSVCSIPEIVNNGKLDSVYVVVKRLINGNWVQYVERFDHRVLYSNIENAWCVDAGLEYAQPTPNANITFSASFGTGVTVTADSGVFTSGDVGKVLRVGNGPGKAVVTAYTDSTHVTVNWINPLSSTYYLANDPNKTPLPAAPGAWTYTAPVTKISGLTHLVGATVAILGDGNVMSPKVVDATGSITLEQACSQIVVGLPYQCQLQTLFLDTGEPTSQGKRKKVSALTVRVQDTRGLKAGRTFATVVPFKERTTQLYGQPVPLQTMDERIVMDPLWDVAGQVCIQIDDPVPATVLAVIPEITLGDTNLATGR